MRRPTTALPRPRQPTPDRHPRRLYNWDPALHGGAAGLAFLDSAAAAGLRVMLPISNYFLEHREAARAIVQRIARHPAILLWAVSNEPDAGSHLSLACIPLRASLRAPRHANTLRFFLSSIMIQQLGNGCM